MYFLPMKGNETEEFRISKCHCTQPVQKYRTEVSNDIYCSVPLIVIILAIPSQY